MAFASYDAYEAARAAPYYVAHASKISTTSVSGRTTSLWTTGNVAVGVAPTTAAAPTSATVGAMAQPNAGGALTLHAIMAKVSATAPGTWVLCDRLSHQGGLDATVTTEQTTNLPTAALTRQTTGAGVMAALEIYTIIGVTGTTATVSYTNQAGTAGRTSEAIVIGGTGFREANRILPISLASGDSGVRSVESVTLAGTTGTAGAFGVTLYRPLMECPIVMGQEEHEYDQFFSGFIPEIVDDACLWWIAHTANINTGVFVAEVHFAED